MDLVSLTHSLLLAFQDPLAPVAPLAHLVMQVPLALLDTKVPLENQDNLALLDLQALLE